MKIILVQLDALSFSYLGEKHTPNLYKFAKKGIVTKLESMLAYDGINSAIFSGTWPEDNNIWTRYKKTSRRFPWINHLISNVKPAPKIPWQYKYLFDYSITPGTFLSYDHYNENKTIFGLLRKFGLTSSYFFGEIELAIDYFKNNKDINKHALLYVHTLGTLDLYGHKYGPFSKKTLAYLKNQDRLIKNLIDIIYKTTKTSEELHLILFSDHGMVDVGRYINITNLLKESLKRKSMIIFVNSTIVQVWGKKKDFEFSKKFMKSKKDVLLADDQKRKKLHINFKDNRYGDLIFVTKPKCVFWPDYFHGNEKVKGMHGYQPGSEELDSILVMHCPSFPKRKIKKAQMIDLFPTMLKILNLPIPKSNKGKSLI